MDSHFMDRGQKASTAVGMLHRTWVIDRAGPGLLLGHIAERLTSGGGALQLALMACAGAYFVAFVGVGVLRATYPYTIDGLEPGVLQEVRRVLVGQPLYVAPELGYVPLIYGPLYFYAAAAVAAVS